MTKSQVVRDKTLVFVTKTTPKFDRKLPIAVSNQLGQCQARDWYWLQLPSPSDTQEVYICGPLLARVRAKVLARLEQSLRVCVQACIQVFSRTRTPAARVLLVEAHTFQEAVHEGARTSLSLLE